VRPTIAAAPTESSQKSQPGGKVNDLVATGDRERTTAGAHTLAAVLVPPPLAAGAGP
jgi:hypothetical protein